MCVPYKGDAKIMNRDSLKIADPCDYTASTTCSKCRGFESKSEYMCVEFLKASEACDIIPNCFAVTSCSRDFVILTYLSFSLSIKKIYLKFPRDKCLFVTGRILIFKSEPQQVNLQVNIQFWLYYVYI